MISKKNVFSIWLVILFSCFLLPFECWSACIWSPSGTVSRWKAESNAKDLVGLNNGTAMAGVSYSVGKVGQTFSFNGAANSYVSIPDSANLRIRSALTVEAWIKVDSFDAEHATIIAKGDYSWRLQRNFSGNSILFGTNNAGPTSWHDLRGSRNVNDGLWHHVAGVYDGSTKYIYVDGVLDVSVPYTGLIDETDSPVWIGNNSDIPSRLWDGQIDEVGVYDRALTADEIAAIYAAGSDGICSCAPLPADIISWWKAEGNASDFIGNNNGTVNGAVYASGRVGEAFSFDGTGDYISIPDHPSLNPTAAITVAAWIFSDNSSSFYPPHR